MIVIVTGPMRSGTSAVARMCHQMGISMGTSFISPPPGTDMELEYEESELARYMISTTQCEDKWFAEYAVTRMMEGRKIWGVKSPFIIPILEPLVKLWSEVDKVVVICTARPIEESMRSLESGMFRAKIAKTEYVNIINAQHELYKQLKNKRYPFDLVVDYADVVRTPLMSVIEPVSKLVGIENYDRKIALAGIEIKSIIAPTH
jgi:hypothetical protein